MKNIYILAALILIFSSCDELKKLTDVTFEDVEFSADVPVATIQTAKGEASDVDGYPFGGTFPLYLNSEEEIAEYIDLVQSIQLTGYTMKPVGLSTENVIHLMTIMVNDVQMFSAADITSTSEFDESSVSQAAIDEFTESLKNDKMVTFSVAGTAAMPAIFTISQLFRTDITANPLN